MAIIIETFNNWNSLLWYTKKELISITPLSPGNPIKWRDIDLYFFEVSIRLICHPWWSAIIKIGENSSIAWHRLPFCVSSLRHTLACLSNYNFYLYSASHYI